MKTTYNKTALLIIGLGVSIASTLGCKKFVEAEFPIDKTTAEIVFSTTGGATAALTNIYYSFYSRGMAGGASSFSITNGLTADELILQDLNNQELLNMYNNTLSTNQFGGSSFWKDGYELVFRINATIEGVERSSGIPASSKSELLGQAKFLRAFVYFYLLNTYGELPIIVTTDYKVNSLLSRKSESDVYNQIVSDLLDAQNLVNVNYLKPDLITTTTERVTANKAVVTAFLARVYLYRGDWRKADEEATKVIANSNYSILSSLPEVFLKNSNETIWQIEGDILKGNNSLDGGFIIPDRAGILPPVTLSDNLLKEMLPDDQRRIDWVSFIVIGTDTFYFPFKYKRGMNVTETLEYNMMLRLAEQYLIRAEARANLNNLEGAIEDLNVIRKRANITLYSTLSQSAVLLAVEKERQMELFSENGHRWFDLKRTHRVDAVLAPIKAPNWQSTDKLFPIPAREFIMNPNLKGHQNPGYSEE